MNLTFNIHSVQNSFKIDKIDKIDALFVAKSTSVPGLGGGGGGLSQSWQCQDFGSSGYGNPSLREADWLHAWTLRRKPGLYPDQKSWLFKWTNGLLVNNVLLHKLGKLPSDKCDFCVEQDSRIHILQCVFSKRINDGILKIIQTCTEHKSSFADIEILDLNIPVSLQLPALFIFNETLRQKKKELQTTKLIASVKTKSEAFLLSKKAAFAHEVIKLWLDTFFNTSMDTVHSQPLLRPSQVVPRPAHPLKPPEH